MTDPHSAVWQRALLAARIAAIGLDRIGGVHLRARAGPVRDAWVSYFKSLLPAAMAWRRITPSVPPGRLIGGLDVARTLEAGRPRLEQGLLVGTDGGILVLSMAERAGADFAATIGAAMDNKGVHIERNSLSLFQPCSFTLLCLDEGADRDETLRSSLADRLAISVDLSSVTWNESLQVAEVTGASDMSAWESVELRPDIEEALEGVLAACGETSLRASLWTRRVCRLVASEAGASAVLPEHAALALQLVYPDLVTDAPTEETENDPRPENTSDQAHRQDPVELPEDNDKKEGIGDSAIPDEILVNAKASALPDFELPESRTIHRRGSNVSGKSGAVVRSGRRGRPIGVSTTPPFPDARLNVAATLRAAAPWQLARRKRQSESGRGSTTPLDVRKSDFRYVRRRDCTETTAIFVVDASGSTALERLGEAKGAAELLLAECYVRREQVGVIGFRGEQSEILLPPTRSLVRAKRCLASLVGGGGTPLAAGMVNALQLAVTTARQGNRPLVVLMTDGSANIALDGSPGRSGARRDADAVALQFQYCAIPTIVVDIARNKRGNVESLAKAMGADYYALPRADAHSVSAVVSTHLRAG